MANRDNVFDSILFQMGLENIDGYSTEARPEQSDEASLHARRANRDRQGAEIIKTVRETVARLCDDEHFDIINAESGSQTIAKLSEAYSKSSDQKQGNLKLV